jgi:hypothetical protein
LEARRGRTATQDEFFRVTGPGLPIFGVSSPRSRCLATCGSPCSFTKARIRCLANSRSSMTLWLLEVRRVNEKREVVGVAYKQTCRRHAALHTS